MNSGTFVGFILVLLVSGGVGRYFGQTDMADACDTKGTFQSRSKVYDCKPIAVVINGQPFLIKSDKP